MHLEKKHVVADIPETFNWLERYPETAQSLVSVHDMTGRLPSW
jgi:hypothetical protein